MYLKTSSPASNSSSPLAGAPAAPSSEVNMNKSFYKVLGKFFMTLVSCAALFFAGIAVAAVMKNSTYSAEWANMVAWFATWAK